MGAKLSVQSGEVPAERTFIVTGANAGIGYQTSKKIAQRGGRVIMACRSEEKAKKAIEQIQEEHRQEVRAKRKAEKDAAEKERQQREAAAAKEQQEKKREEERKKREEAKKAQAKKEEETAKEGEEKKEDGDKKAEETENKTEEKPAEGGEEKPAEDGEKPAEDGEKPAEEAEKPAEEEAKAAEDGDKPAEGGDKPDEGGAKEEVAAPAAKEDGDAPAEAEPEPEEEIPELKIQFMPLDLASFKSVLEFVKQFKESGLTLHTLICNGGLIAPNKVMTEDGLESSFQINYLSHFLLTLHLLPLLKASAPNSKIINITSSGHKTGDGVNLSNIQSQKSFSQAKAYANSKLFQIMNMFTLHSKIKDTGIDVFSVHPGFVDTQFTRGYSGFLKAVSLFHKGFGRNSVDGAATTLTAALDEQYNGKGPIYFASCKPSQPSNLSRNEEQQTVLWRYSLELLREHVDDTILAEIGETLESIQPKEPEPVPEPAAEGDDKKDEEGAKEEAKAEDKKEDADAEEKEAAPSQETEEKEKEEEEPSEAKKEDGEVEKKDEE